MPLKMGSHGDASGSVQTQNHELRSNALPRQGSLYSLTLDEVQNQLGSLGKPLASMNIDELLRIVWTAEIRQGVGGVGYGASSQHHQGASGSSLQRQSSYMLSRDLSNKTVYEVWRDIQQGQKSINPDSETPERQATLGEMTLEDFLVMAGVIAKTAPRNNSGLVLGVDPIPLPPQQAQWTDYQTPSNHQQQPHPPPQQQNLMPVFIFGHPFQQPTPIGLNPMMNVAHPESQMTVAPMTLTGTLLDAQTPGGDRVISGDVVETSHERSQRRKIRNRISAEQSRARKQAYTFELEKKVSRLKGENERLKRRQMLENLLPGLPTLEPRYQLRRTSSAPF